MTGNQEQFFMELICGISSGATEPSHRRLCGQQMTKERICGGTIISSSEIDSAHDKDRNASCNA